jgi:hypothetical protein
MTDTPPNIQESAVLPPDPEAPTRNLAVTPGAEPGTTIEPMPASLIVAMIWGVIAVILAIVLLAAATDGTYGGEAYTGIQNAVMLAVRGIAFLLFGSAALGFVIATRRDHR